ncbi:helix-turn-helix transcriptional regulator [Streptomyces sp. NPDC047130]|uniref:helix-turn-helix domain-containing protein n=1 Tax=Streptomyces sp. NPDC047130 TaxID=3155261 RepID=UPI0033F3D025
MTNGTVSETVGTSLTGEGGPTTRRRQLGLRLLALREAAGLSAEEAGERAGMSKATVSRYERAKGNVRWNQVDQLCRAYGVSDAERQELVELAKNSKATEAWWLPLAGKLPGQLRMLLALENEASSISQHTIGVIPGLLQTRDYAQAIKVAPEAALPPAELDIYLSTRMQRQQILDRPAPPSYHVVLDESVIHRPVGGAAVMAAQLHHLLKRAEQPHVTVQVLPFSSGAYSVALSSFIVFGGFGGPDPALDVVFLEHPVGSLFLEEAPVLAEYSQGFAHLCRQALDPGASAELIDEARQSYVNNRK